jgi:hypothetical protein
MTPELKDYLDFLHWCNLVLFFPGDLADAIEEISGDKVLKYETKWKELKRK